MTPRVLFVDDEAVLAGLRRGLWRHRDRVDPVFASDTATARKLLAGGPCDVAIVDLATGQDGATELFEHLRASHPATVRIAFSGTCEPRRWLDGLSLAHRFVGKPCDPDRLVCHIEESLGAVSAAPGRLAELLRGLSEPGALGPSYHEALAELAHGEPRLTKVARIVSSDVGATTRLLRLANSSWFGGGAAIVDVERAVVRLGADVVQAALVLLGLGADNFGSRANTAAQLHHHLQSVATIAGVLVDRRADVGVARSAGLLHDIGRLALLRASQTEYGTLADGCGPGELGLAATEIQRLGTDHGRCGGYLLRLWGLPARIADIVDTHHDLDDPTPSTIDAATAVRLAELVVNDDLERWAERGGQSAPERRALAEQTRARVAEQLPPNPARSR